jgi:hypothetical protein
MAIKLINKEYCPYLMESRMEYICDTDDDFVNLPTCVTGSTALSVASGTVLMVNASGEWAVFAG